MWEGLPIISTRSPNAKEIVDIQPVGEQEVVSIETTTKTYIANGMVSHNCEDLDMHRRYLLGGDGDKIFSVNLPYLHLASQTLKSVSPEQRQRIEHQIETVSRAHYLRSWGGPVNAETYLRKGDPSSAVTDGTATTPHLQAHPPEAP